VRGGTPPNKGPPQTRDPLKQGNPLKQGGGNPLKQVGNTTKQEKKYLLNKKNPSKWYLPIKCKSLQVVGVFSQGKAVVSDSGYGVIGGVDIVYWYGVCGGNQGETGAAMAWGRSRWSSVSVPLWR